MATAADDAVQSSVVTLFSGLTTFGALAYVTVLLFDQLAVGVIVGLMSGVGTALFVPYVMRAQGSGPTSGHAGSRIHRGAVGAALSGSGIFVLALMFVFEDPVTAVGIGVALAAVEYVVWSLVLPRA